MAKLICIGLVCGFGLVSVPPPAPGVGVDVGLGGVVTKVFAM